MLHPPGFCYVKKPKRFVILSSDKCSERNLSCFFDIIKPRRMEHQQSEEPFSSDPYFSPHVLICSGSPELLIKFTNRVLFLFSIGFFFQIFMNHNKNNMWFINWDTFMTLYENSQLRFDNYWPHSLTSGYPQSRVALRSGKAVYVRWGFEVGSNTCLATSWCTRKDLRDTSLYCYCCMVYKKRTLTEKELTGTEY